MLFLNKPALILLGILATGIHAWLPDGIRDANQFNQSIHDAPGNSTFSKRNLPGFDKIRGVNLGSLFVFEPWMASGQWNNMGCGPYKSEFDCVVGIGQDRADAVFQQHYSTWITQADIARIKSYGLNTIRIPLGYWLFEPIIYWDSEHFPHGHVAFPYLEQICEWAAQAGLYVIIDLHAAPGAQQANQPFTGQYAPNAGFYKPWQYDRAYQMLSWITEVIHRWPAFRTVGMLEILNEPSQDPSVTTGLLDQYYPGAYAAIRAREAKIGIGGDQSLHVQVMNTLWGSGNPETFLTDKQFMAYDDHRNWPTIVGEFSLSVPDNVQWNGDWHPDSNKDFYNRWFAAQIIRYERDTNGWIFWSWKTQLGDYRWSYQEAVAAGVIPSNAASINRGAFDTHVKRILEFVEAVAMIMDFIEITISI
ncbi:putative Glucan endo-1,6-beta-glucosidase B [Glarea lozoyensis 74030]|uniref:glucan endo-1,6-beta-glucosidase n=1 Tax=Glarea lozoyensis (strain ATCC 74030 / MF5533) TaxID=1104152 RepID=H0EVE3_GLAL7|nr:putative Glucan endo-1,6-beta-glucosidase B [Glarea lozoyensis 74030]